jgi:hypothetical protein
VLDLDSAFDDLRNDISGSASGPPVPDLQRRARKRVHRRFAASLILATAVALGGVLLLPERQPTPALTIGTPSPAAPQPVKISDLIHGREASTDQLDWVIGIDEQSDDSPVTGCLSHTEKPFNEGMVSGFSLIHDPNGRPRDGEQVLVFRDVAGARRWVTLLNTPCDSTVKTLQIGDEAFRTRSIQKKRGDLEVVTDVVVVRQGTAIAIYWFSLYRSIGKKLPGPDTLERDATTMVARLKGLGY